MRRKVRSKARPDGFSRRGRGQGDSCNSVGQRLEILEDRSLLNVVGVVDWATQYDEVNSLWFASASSEVASEVTSAAEDSVSGRSIQGADFPSSLSLDAHRWIVRLSPEALTGINSVGDAARLLSGYGSELQVIRGLGLPGLVLIQGPEASTVEMALRANPAVATFEQDSPIQGERIPNDLFFSEQWNLNNTGQAGGVSDADIDATEAWEANFGNARVAVAVLDSGVDCGHPDLFRNIWINQAEIPNSRRANLVDRDGDGLITFWDLNDPVNWGPFKIGDVNGDGQVDASDILSPMEKDAQGNDLGTGGWADGRSQHGDPSHPDDLIGWNFVQDNNRPFDENGHGTHVAGILGATGNDAGGIAGVNWKTSILPLQILDENSLGSVSDGVAAINYATLLRTRDGANVRVTNNSWGASGTYYPSLQQAVFASGQAGILFVAAAGNGDVLGFSVNNDRIPFYPASYPLENVLSVAATDAYDQLAYFSNYGLNSVDIAAPGLAILSTAPGGGYAVRSGTSMAAPHVAGTAALVWSHVPDATLAEVRTAVLSGADYLPQLADKLGSGGRLNARGALEAEVYAPKAQLSTASDIATAGVAFADITVTYSDRTGVDITTLDGTDVLVVRQGNTAEPLSASLQSAIPVSGGLAVTVTYRVTAPDGTWHAVDNEIYEIRVQADQVENIQGRALRAVTVGTFRVNVPVEGCINVTDFYDSDESGSLRWAVLQANAAPGPNTIILAPGTYRLRLSEYDEDLYERGDLDILDEMTIVGAGAEKTIIEAPPSDRVLDVHPSASLTLVGLSLQGGFATYGGAIRNDGVLDIEACDLRRNSAWLNGGAVFNSGTLTITNSTIEYNHAQGMGGGLYANSGLMTVRSSTLSSNVAYDGGGGLANAGAAVGQLSNTSVYYNRAFESGGGIWNASGGSLSLVNCTVCFNSAANGSAAVNASGGTFRVLNTILTGDYLDSEFLPDVVGRFDSQGFNLVRVAEGSISGFTAPGDLAGTATNPIDPLLEFSAPDGRQCVIPSAGSPAVDRGTAAGAPSVDLLGIPRPKDGDADGTAAVDIGANERYYAQIRGVKFNDVNGNSFRDPGEPGLSDWIIFLDENSNGQLDRDAAGNPLEPSTVTDGSGNYSFDDLPPDRSYTVAEVPQNGWRRTCPVGPTSGSLTFWYAYVWEPPPSNDSASWTECSPDGRHMYMTYRAESADFILVCERNRINGGIQVVDALQDGEPDGWGNEVAGMERPRCIILSPDGRNAYVAAIAPEGPSLVALARDTWSGSLFFQGYLADDTVDEQGNVVSGLAGATAMAFSPDGVFLYVAGESGGSVAVFRRNPDSGALTFVEAIRDGQPDSHGNVVNTLGGVGSLAVSPEGDWVYVSAHGDNAVTVFRRDQTSGRLTWDWDWSEPDTSSPIRFVAVSRNGGYVDVATDSGVRVFHRDFATGQWLCSDTIRNGETDSYGTVVQGVGVVSSMTISSDGQLVCIASSSAGETPGESVGWLAVFRQDRFTGRLAFVEAICDGGHDGVGNEITDLHSDRGCFSPHGDYFYSSNQKGGAILRCNGFPVLPGTHVTDAGRTGAEWDFDFGSTMEGRKICGSVFNDLDQDATPDLEEPGLPERCVYIDYNRNGRLDADEPSTLTDATGNYALTDLPDHPSYPVAEVLPEDWQQTYPGDAGSGMLTFQSDLTDDVPSGGTGVVASPDGRNVYSSRGGEVEVLRRDPESGSLTVLDGVEVPGTVPILSVAVSPDGNYVYAGCGNVMSNTSGAIAVFSRDASDGSLTLVQWLPNGSYDFAGNVVQGISPPTELAVSSDGHDLYAAPGGGYSDWGVAIFTRDPGTGMLSLVTVYMGPRGFPEPGDCRLAVSRDGRYFYMANYPNPVVTIVSRDSVFDGTYPGGSAVGYNPRDIAFSPDGRQFYVIGTYNLSVFNQDADTGALTLVEELKHGRADSLQHRVEGLSFPEEVVVSADGRNVYVTDPHANTVAVFQVIPATGRLAFLETLGMDRPDSAGQAVSISAPQDLAVSPDGQHVYVQGDWLVGFEREAVASVPGEHLVRLNAWQFAENIDFGNAQGEISGEELNGSIRGRAYQDLNGNGRADPGELGIAGVTIFLDMNTNGQLDAGDLSTQTSSNDPGTPDINESGLYQFSGRPSGSHTVRAAPPSGLVPSSPLSNVLSTAQFSANNGPRAIAAGDFNDDGLVDLAVANAGTNQISMLWATADHSYQSPAKLTVQSDPWAVVAAQLNDDNGDDCVDQADRLDLIVSNFSNDSVSVFLNNGHGLAPAVHYRVFADLTAIPAPSGVATGDFNHDGYPDLAVAVITKTSGRLAVLLNRRDGTFSNNATVLEVGQYPISLVPLQAGDDNNDGAVDSRDNLDLAVACFEPDIAVGSVRILAGNGDGSFRLSADLPVGCGAFSIASGDLNGDGTADLVTANATGNNVSVLLARVGGGFSDAVNYAVAAKPSSVAIVDLDKDTDLDLIVAATGARQVCVLRNRGSGRFNPMETVAGVGEMPTSLPFAVVSADVDGDGSPDLAVTNAIERKVSVLRNTLVPGAHSIVLSVSEVNVTGLDFGWQGASLPVNNPPQISDIANQSTYEDTTTATIAFTVSDQETAATAISLTATSSNTALVPVGNIAFGGSGASRSVIVTPVDNHIGTATITVIVDDGTGGTTSDSFVLTVVSVNDAPAGTDQTVSVPEDGNYIFATADFGFTDPLDSPANSLAKVKITTLPAVGSLKLHGTGVAAGTVVLATEIQAGKLTFTPVADANGTSYASFKFQVQDDGGTSNGGVDVDSTNKTLTIDVTPVTDIRGRYLFYNNSALDGGSGLANSLDYSAIAPAPPVCGHGHAGGLDESGKELGKQALLPGQTAAFVNYSSYAKGINGIMIAFDNLANPAALSPSDFVFRVGNENAPAGWTAAPAPKDLRVDQNVARFSGSPDVVTITWNDEDPYTTPRESGAISNQWLQVTVLAGGATGLTAADVFYWGNQIGESGSAAADTNVDQNDEIGARNHPHTAFNQAPLSDPYDFNRDGKVDQNDEILTRNNPATAFTRIAMIAAPSMLLAEGCEPTGTRLGGGIVDSQSVAPIVAEAIAQWEATDLDRRQVEWLRQTQYVVLDLGRGTLGSASIGSKVIFLDDDGSGFGWFLDKTPGRDEEFFPASGRDRKAAPDRPAYGRMDLLTAVMHEMGHMLGRPDLDSASDDLMAGRLATGIRRGSPAGARDKTFAGVETWSGLW